MKTTLLTVLYFVLFSAGTTLGDLQKDMENDDETGQTDADPFAFIDQAANFYYLMEAYSQITEPIAKLRKLGPAEIQMVTGGLVAGVASRIFEADMIEHGLHAAKIEGNCKEMVACELGSFILHSHDDLAELLVPVYRGLFKPTSKYWKHMNRGLNGIICADAYPSCERGGYYMQR